MPLSPLSKSPTPVVKKQGALWVALFAGKIVFKSLERKNVEDFIRYSWNGVNPITGE